MVLKKGTIFLFGKRIFKVESVNGDMIRASSKIDGEDYFMILHVTENDERFKPIPIGLGAIELAGNVQKEN